MELHIGLDFYLVHLVGIGETERAAQIHPFAGGLETAFGYSTVADNLNIKTLGGGGATLRALLVGFVYTVLPLLVTPLVSLDPYVFMPILAVAGVVVAVVVGRLLLSITARNIEVYE